MVGGLARLMLIVQINHTCIGCVGCIAVAMVSSWSGDMNMRPVWWIAERSEVVESSRL